jgi:hypothetical protein
MHPVITPEYYKQYPLQSNNIVKSLYLSSDKLISPQIVTDTAENAISLFFPDYKPKCLFFEDMFHIYMDPFIQLSKKHVNFVTTFYLRNSYRNKYGKSSFDSISGDVLIFGTLNISTNTIDGKDHSVPYNIVEEMLEIYDIQINS